MKPPSLDFHPADVLPLGELTLLWREVYTNYPVPLPFTEDEFERFIRMSDIDLGLSQIATVDGAPVGLSLTAQAEKTSWVGGFGVKAAQRRTGVGLALIRHQSHMIEQAGALSSRLEVLSDNPARRLYAKAGFIDWRRLHSFNSPAVSGGADPLVVLPLDQLPDLHRRLHVGASIAPWQRELERVERTVRRDRLTLLGWRSANGVAAYAIEGVSGGVSRLIDAAADNEVAAEALVASLAARSRGRRLSLGDEPAASPIAHAFRRFGAAPRAQRHEMMRLSSFTARSDLRSNTLAEPA